MKIEIVRATEIPNELLKLACDHTMVAEPTEGKSASQELIDFLIKADHMSVFEHCKITFKISEVSRSLMAQLTRHRAGVFTCQSQHYQNYGDVPAIKTGDESLDMAIEKAYYAYSSACERGIVKEVARQVLPNAASVNILWTVDARNLYNFIVMRLCERNVPEMVTFAYNLRAQACSWWPELFEEAGPHCYTHGCCNQGKMQAAQCKKVKLCN